MIPSRMNTYLRERLPDSAWDKRLVRDGDLCFLEFDSTDVDQLARLGIAVDALGPYRVICMWDETSFLEIGGYLVVDNLAMGKPSMGGIRMLPEVTPAAIHNLARGMTLKNAAAHLPYGGGKSGIVAEHGLTPEQHTEVIRGWAHLIYRYRDIYLPGPDVGTNDADMKTIAIENGIDHALSKPADMGGNRIDQLGAAAGGTVISLQELLEEMPRLRALPQFESLTIPDEVTILIQGLAPSALTPPAFCATVCLRRKSSAFLTLTVISTTQADSRSMSFFNAGSATASSPAASSSKKCLRAKVARSNIPPTPMTCCARAPSV